MSSRGAEMYASTSTWTIAGEDSMERPSGRARNHDRQRALADVHAHGAERGPLRSGQPRQAELADQAVALELVHHLAGERHPPAARAAAVVAAARGERLAAEDRREVWRHAVRVRPERPKPCRRLLDACPCRPQIADNCNTNR